MSWETVGQWIKENAGSGASLVGSLISGNVPGAVAAGVAMVSSVTGTNDPQAALRVLQTNPESLVRLRELANQESASVRDHLAEMTRLELDDAQEQHKQTQETIRAGDQAQSKLVRHTRPLQSWLSLSGALVYIYYEPSPDIAVLTLLFTLPFAYAGLRQVGKGIDAIVTKKASG